MSQNPHLIVICGPTGIGKTSVAVSLAEKLECEIISADSRQLFREMKIGTAVPSEEELSRVRHHFIRSHSIADPYNASMYEQEVIRFLESYFKNNNRIIMVGGSGMYIDAVCHGIDDLPTIRPEIRREWRDLFEEKGISFLQEKVRQIDPEYYKTVDLSNHKRLLKAIEVFEQTGKSYSSFLKNEPKRRSFEGCTTGKFDLSTIRLSVLWTPWHPRDEWMIPGSLLPPITERSCSSTAALNTVTLMRTK